MQKNNDVLILTEIAILTAVAIVFDVIANWTQIRIFPNGGSVSLAMLPIFVIAFRRGIVAGLTTGLLVGLIQTIFGAYFLTPVQYMFDYPIPYMLVGFAGVTSKWVLAENATKQTLGIIVGILIGGLFRYASHVYAGIAYWAEYSEWPNFIVGWSLFYNATYLVPSMIICGVFAILFNAYARQLYTKDFN